MTCTRITDWFILSFHVGFLLNSYSYSLPRLQARRAVSLNSNFKFKFGTTVGKKCLFFDKGHPNYNGKKIVFKNFTTAKVKSSNGIVQHRYKVKTHVIVFSKKYSINLTLNDRDDMKYPILIGRKFLLKKFMVDVDLKNVSFKEKVQFNNPQPK